MNVILFSFILLGAVLSYCQTEKNVSLKMQLQELRPKLSKGSPHFPWRRRSSTVDSRNLPAIQNYLSNSLETIEYAYKFPSIITRLDMIGTKVPVLDRKKAETPPKPTKYNFT